jgi:limonene-1,2-epoxide hydrolase
MQETTPTEVVHAFVSAINAANLDAIHGLMAEDHAFTDASGNSFCGAEKMRRGWEHFFHTYPGYKISISCSFADGKQVALFGKAAGGWRVNDVVHPQSWTVPAAWLAEVENEKIKNWSVFCETNWANPPT